METGTMKLIWVDKEGTKQETMFEGGPGFRYLMEQVQDSILRKGGRPREIWRSEDGMWKPVKITFSKWKDS